MRSLKIMLRRPSPPLSRPRRIAPARRTFFVLAAVLAGLFGFAFVSPTNARAKEVVDNATIRPFHFTASDDSLSDLRSRIAATRWPDKEMVTDDSQGVWPATMQVFAHYRVTDFDWRNCEAKSNVLPQLVTEIDGLDIHFILVHSKHASAMSVIVTRGWPGSVIEQIKIIDPLTDPTACGEKPEDAFDALIPSPPGYGISGKPTVPGWDDQHIASAWTVMMKRLGYATFVAQGGDWGNAVSEQMGLRAPPELLGISANIVATVPAEISKAMKDGQPPPLTLTADQRRAWDQLNGFFETELGYSGEVSKRPQTLHAIADCAFTRDWSVCGSL